MVRSFLYNWGSNPLIKNNNFSGTNWFRLHGNNLIFENNTNDAFDSLYFYYYGDNGVIKNNTLLGNYGSINLGCNNPDYQCDINWWNDDYKGPQIAKNNSVYNNFLATGTTTVISSYDNHNLTIFNNTFTNAKIAKDSYNITIIKF